MAGVVDLHDVPPGDPGAADALVEVLVMKDQHVVADRRIGRCVDSPNGERPVAGENGALERDILSKLPAKFAQQPLADQRPRPVLQERLLLIRRDHDLRIHREIRLGVHREVGEEALAVAVAPTEPVRPAHAVHAGHRFDAVGVRQRQREHEPRGVQRDEPPCAAESRSRVECRDDRAQRGEQEQRERHTRDRQNRAALMAAEIRQYQRQIFHATAAFSMRSPFSRCNTDLARSAA